MKANRIERSNRIGLVATAILVTLAAIGFAVAYGYDRLRDIYLEQCVITDFAAQVEINSGKMVRPDVIAENLGLRKGANLALIDFTRKREDILRRIPTLRDISIRRHLPDRITVVAEERIPIARMNVRGGRRETGRVTDVEGMVFLCQRGTQTLPVIREPTPPGTATGTFVRRRTRAALTLVEACREPAYAELGLLEVDTAKRDYLLATLGNYSKVKIAWEGMDEPSPKSQEDLARRLDNLVKAIRSRVASDTVIWNATLADRIFADTQAKP